MNSEMKKGMYLIKFFAEGGKGLYLDTVAPEPGPIGAPGTVKSLPPGTRAGVVSVVCTAGRIIADTSLALVQWYLNKREDGLWTISTGGYDGYETFPMDKQVHCSSEGPGYAWKFRAFPSLPETMYRSVFRSYIRYMCVIILTYIAFELQQYHRSFHRSFMVHA